MNYEITIKATDHDVVKLLVRYADDDPAGSIALAIEYAKTLLGDNDLTLETLNVNATFDINDADFILIN